MSQTSYLVSCEVLCGEGSDGALEGMDRAYLIVGVNAASEDDAMTKIEASFEEEGYAIVDVEWISVASEMEWETLTAKPKARTSSPASPRFRKKSSTAFFSPRPAKSAKRPDPRKPFYFATKSCGHCLSGRFFVRISPRRPAH